MKTTSTNPTTTYKRYILVSKNGEYFNRIVENDEANWTPHITKAYLFARKDEAEFVQEAYSNRTCEIKTVEVSFQIQ